MTLLNVTAAPHGAWLSTDSAFGPAPANMADPVVSGDVECMRAQTSCQAPSAKPVVGGHGRKLAIVGKHLVIAGTGFFRPLQQLAYAIERNHWGVDDAAERGPAELQRIVAETPSEASAAIVVAGWSCREDKAAAYVLTNTGLASQRIEGQLTSPLPAADDPDYRELYELYSLQVGTRVDELHRALALNQFAASVRGFYAIPIAIGGLVEMLCVTRDRIEHHVLLDLAEHPLS